MMSRQEWVCAWSRFRLCHRAIGYRALSNACLCITLAWNNREFGFDPLSGPRKYRNGRPVGRYISAIRSPKLPT